MTAIFEALQNFKPKKVPLPTVTIDGKKVEVEPKLFREICLLYTSDAADEP